MTPTTSTAPADAPHRPARGRGWTSRLPLRMRLVAGFCAAMLVVLAGAGAFLPAR